MTDESSMIFLNVFMSSWVSFEKLGFRSMVEVAMDRCAIKNKAIGGRGEGFVDPLMRDRISTAAALYIILKCYF